MGTPGASAAQELAAALSRLYRDAGSPPYRVLVDQGEAQRPPVKLNDATLSDWFNGAAVPASPKAFTFLVTHLQARAVRLAPGRNSPHLDWWNQQRRKAQQQRRSGPAAGGEADRSASSLSAPPRQLPAPPSDFTGRRRDLDELIAPFALPEASSRADPDMALCPAPCHSPVVIYGLPGVGKSALALRLARELIPRYPDGQLYAALRGEDGPVHPDVVLGQFLRALGTAPNDLPSDPAELAALYRSTLAGRRVLVVLDDARSEQQIRPLLPGGSTCLTVVTSRSALPALASATSYPLDLLDADESLELFSLIGGAERVAADLASAEFVVQMCGQLPLALRIAAARFRARTDWTIANLAERLAGVRGRLPELRVGDLDVRGSFELSYQDLPDEARRLFRRLGVTPGAVFSAGLAAELIGQPAPDTDELIERLILDQLVQPAEVPGTYRMHSLLRELAGELLNAAPESDGNPALTSMLTWYATNLHIADIAVSPKERASAEADPEAARAWLDTEEANLLPLLGYSNALGLDDYTANAAREVAVVVKSRSRVEECRYALNLGLDAAERIDNGNLQALLLFELGEFQLMWEFDETAAEESYTKAVHLLDSHKFPALASRLHVRLAHMHRSAGRTKESERELSASVTAAAATGDPDAELVPRLFEAEGLIDQGEYRKAIRLLKLNIEAWSQQNVMVEVPWRMVLARAYLNVERYAAATAQLERCRELSDAHGIRIFMPEVLWLLGRALRARGLRARAENAWEQGLRLIDEYPAPPNHGMFARLAHERAASHKESGEYARAEELFAMAADHFGLAKQPFNRSGARDRQAQAALVAGDPAKAASLWRAAVEELSILEGAGEQPERAVAAREVLERRLASLKNRRPSPG
ncbi:ATP-binding protein [Streptomyces polygonati]|uniref:ATP-binding protein n=1 Tax=Streptomyces polygonati TaxID=1617087 RepID=A0ABV8HYR9_9ACTN